LDNGPAGWDCFTRSEGVNVPRAWKILAAMTLLARPAFGQGALDTTLMQRDIAAGTALVDQWIECTQVAATKLAGSSQEGAEVVAIAVFGTCSGFQERLYQHFLRTNMTVNSADDYTAKIRSKMREHIITQVVTLRAKSLR
jgi:hypothetical protein